MATDLSSFKPGIEEEVEQQLDCPEYLSDDFRVNCFKVVPCSKRCNHDWTTCPFAHPGEKARRRDPKKCKYAAIACIDMKNSAVCPRGEECPYAHNVFEYWMHPTRYRTQICNDGTKCTRKICFFAHKTSELRVPPHKPGFPPDWHKGKKHGRSKSAGFPSAKHLESIKGRMNPQRMNSVPTEAGLPKPAEHRDLFKSNSFPSGQFPRRDTFAKRTPVDDAFKAAQQFPHLRFSEAWDMEQPLRGNSMPDSPVYQMSSPLATPWQTHPLDHRRSMDSLHMGPPIPENASVMGPCHGTERDQQLQYFIEYLQTREHLPPAMNSPMNVAALAGNYVEAENASHQMAGSSQPPMAYNFCQGNIGEAVDGMKCPQWHCDFPVYNSIEDEADLINHIGLLSMTGGIGVPSQGEHALYPTGVEGNSPSGVPMAY